MTNVFEMVGTIAIGAIDTKKCPPFSRVDTAFSLICPENTRGNLFFQREHGNCLGSFASVPIDIFSFDDTACLFSLCRLRNKNLTVARLRLIFFKLRCG